ncbi:MAG: aldehyde dehydrogenase family protein [Acidimicrobiia bacterium]
MEQPLTHLEAGMPIVYGGDKVALVDAELAKAFCRGDRLVVVQITGDLLHIPHADWEAATEAVDQAVGAFAHMGAVSDVQIDTFFRAFAARLDDEASFAPVAEANEADVERARERGRSTTRLVLSEGMRHSMVEGLEMWAQSRSSRGEVVETVEHEGWILEQVRAGLGVVGFVFEGRPNVLADAAGVLRGGNTVVFRIGSDALETARAMMEHAVEPALEESGLPAGALALVDARSHAAGWALFADSRLGLAVARGSGAAVSQLGAVARQAGIPVSLHGTGGAWIIAGDQASVDWFAAAVFHSLDRKVCNTVNTVCIPESRADDLVPAFLDALERAGQRRGTVSKLHATEAAAPHVPDGWWEEAVITRAEGEVREPRTELIGDGELGREWEWEESPEVTLTVVPGVDTAVELFNVQSPHFIATLISEDQVEHRRFFETIDAPFVGNGFTRWVDGQFALGKPELGLSNWQEGRLFGRGGILSGDSVFTVRTRVIQEDPEIGR